MREYTTMRRHKLLDVYTIIWVKLERIILRGIQSQSPYCTILFVYCLKLANL